MINKENDKKQSEEKISKDKVIENAKMAVNCHVLIKDKDTKQILLNKRG